MEQQGLVPDFRISEFPDFFLIRLNFFSKENNPESIAKFINDRLFQSILPATVQYTSHKKKSPQNTNPYSGGIILIYLIIFLGHSSLHLPHPVHLS